MDAYSNRSKRYFDGGYALGGQPLGSWGKAKDYGSGAPRLAFGLGLCLAGFSWWCSFFAPFFAKYGLGTGGVSCSFVVPGRLRPWRHPLFHDHTLA